MASCSHLDQEPVSFPVPISVHVPEPCHSLIHLEYERFFLLSPLPPLCLCSSSAPVSGYHRTPSPHAVPPALLISLSLAWWPEDLAAIAVESLKHRLLPRAPQNSPVFRGSTHGPSLRPASMSLPPAPIPWIDHPAANVALRPCAPNGPCDATGLRSLSA